LIFLMVEMWVSNLSRRLRVLDKCRKLVAAPVLAVCHFLDRAPHNAGNDCTSRKTLTMS
jgi:hypothetical protein